MKKSTRRIYADYNSTAPISINKELNLSFYNPSSIHWHGRQARDILNASRNSILKSLNAEKMSLIFTSSGTEANNMVCNCVENYNYIVSAVEHPSIIKALKSFQELSVDSKGLIQLDVLESLLSTYKPSIVSVMMANNETGVIQPIKEVVNLSHKYDAIVHTDAVQALGRIRIDVEDLDIDMLTISGHKIGAGFGAAALLFKPRISIKPMLFGGMQENGLRASTENITAIYNFASMVEQCVNLDKVDIVRRNRDLLESRISNLGKIIGLNSPRLPNTSCIVMSGVPSEVQVVHFDMHGISISNGSACSYGIVDSSRVLNAMKEKESSNAIRISIGHGNTRQDILDISECWQSLYYKCK